VVSGADHREESTAVVSAGDLEAVALFDCVIEGGSLDQCPSKRGYEFFQVASGHQLTVFCPCGPGDVLVHQGPTQIVDPRTEKLAYPVEADLDPGSLHVVDESVVGDSCHSMHKEGFSEGRASARAPLEVDRGGHVDERQAHELGKSPGFLLEVATSKEVADPVFGVFHGSEHDGDVGADSKRMSSAVGLKPLISVDLVRA